MHDEACAFDDERTNTGEISGLKTYFASLREAALNFATVTAW